jgi:acetoin utilization deacetylase AcuC-like enzyme
VVWSEQCLLHEPGGEVWLGVRDVGTEVPARAQVLRDALAAAGAPVVPAAAHGDEILRAVHDPELLDHLAGVWAQWEQAGFPAEWGRDRVVPYVFPTEGMLDGLPVRMPPAVHGRAGRFCYDTMTLVGPGSWAAIRGAADAALTAAGLVSSGERLAYALCRPPGHHAYRDIAGGFCFLNNSAIAAAHLRLIHERVAILDVDVHHGNGTQGIFYERGDVLTVSIHADPAFYYPYVWGYAHERGAGAGLGANLNIPLPLKTGDDGYMRAFDVAAKAIDAFAPGALVVALGLDASEHDPLAGLAVTTDGFRRIGAALARLGLPTVLVQEGGYLSEILGTNLTAVLAGFEGAR